MNKLVTSALHSFVATACGVLAMQASLLPASAQQGGLVVTVTDGKPWTMTPTDGPGTQLTLHPDGSGKMIMGSRTATPTWRQSEAGQLCIKPLMVVPERCATLRREGVSIVGMRDGQVQFRLTRP